MSTIERRQSQGRVEVTDLAEQFAVSTVTIGTDLNYLISGLDKNFDYRYTR